MSAFLAGIRFEFEAVRRAPGALVILAAAALFYGLIYPAPYSPQVYRDLPVYALDGDGSALSRELLARIDASPDLAIVAGSGDRRAARLALERGEVMGIIEIPAGLQRQARRGESPVVGVYANAGYLLAYSEVASAAGAVVLETAAELGVAVETARQGDPGRALAVQAPLGIDVVRLYDPAGGYASFVVPAVLVVILQQTLLIGLGLLCEARREGRPAPEGWLARTGWVLGRAAPWTALYLLQLLLIRWGVFALYDLPDAGTVWRVLPFMALFLLAAALFGLLLAEGFRRSDDVIPLLLFTSLPVVFLSGFSWPTPLIPEPLQWLARLLPSTPGVEGFVRLNQLGADFSDIMGPALNLSVLVILFAAILTWRGRPSQARARGGSAAASARGLKSS